MPGVREALMLGIAVAVGGGAAHAQQADIAAALDLERQGRPTEAADRFMAALDAAPTNTVALLGLERTLQAGGVLDRVFPYLERAFAAQPDEPVAHAIELRALATLQRTDDLAAAASRWMAADPESPEPYRVWAFVLAQHGDLAAAETVLERGHARIGGSSLEAELAQLAVAGGRWVEAARHWYAAAAGDAGYQNAAGVSLGQTRPEDQSGVLQVLLGEIGDALARRIAADVMLAWGRAGEAWSLLDANLPDAPLDAMTALRRFADRARVVPGADAARARGYALERLASMQTGAAAQRSRIDAARAFAEGGDRGAAERLLGDIARHPDVAPPGTADAMAELIRLVADAGRPADAAQRLDTWGAAIPPGTRQVLQQHIAGAWVRAGEVARAEAALGADSTVAALALRGWIALFRGDLTLALQHFRDAGPYAGSREEATQRTTAAALIQRLGGESAPEVGQAFLALTRGDTLGAVTHLEQAARCYPPGAGRGDLLGFAGQLALAVANERAAELFAQALAADSAGPVAPVAELGLAELAWRAGRVDEARQRLEHIILDYPTSAVVPQARRLLDKVRGAIPSS